MGDNGSITSIERAFRQFLPGDARLGLLFQAKLKHLISLGVKEEVLIFLRNSTYAELKSAEVLVKKYFFTQILLGETKTLELLKLLPVFSQKLTAAEKSKIKAWFKQKSKSELIELMVLAPGSTNALYSLDPNYIKPLLPALLKQILKRIDEWQRMNKATPHGPEANERSDKIRVAYRTLVTVIAEFSDINPQLSDVWLAAAFSKHSNNPSTLTGSILDPLLNEIYLSGRTALKAILQKYLRPFLEKHKLYPSFSIIDIRKVPDQKVLKSILFTFAKDFPAFGSQVLRSLQDQSRNYGLINRAEFSKQIESLLPIKTLEEKFQEIVYSIQDSSPLLISKINVSQVTQFMRNAWIQIPNHEEFNDIVKSMVLIDSALLSEDLRRMSATQPWKRFNEQFIHDDGTSDYQPAWENFLTGWTLLTKNLKNRATVWNDDLRSDSMNNLSPLTSTVSTLTQEIGNAHSQMISSGVDGSSHLSTQAKYYLSDWDRKKYQNDMSVSQITFLGDSADMKMANQFYIFEKDSNGDLKYRFADISELSEINPAFRNFLKEDKLKDLSQAGPNELMSFLAWTIYDEKDAVRRAAKILHLVPKIHPNENGNGRLARTWAAVEISAAGYPIPIAFQTNDFLMNEERIYWELRRSMALGKLWESMVRALSAKGVPVNDLFQKHYKGSALEGLTLLRPTSEADLKSFVKLLESNGSKEFASDAQELFNEKMLLDGRRQVNQLNELQQAIIFEEIWQIIKKKNPQAFSSVALPRQCSAVFEQ